MKVDRFRPAWVSEIPEELDPGVLYLALEYDAVAHVCACGCGNEVATPIGPTDWKIAWDGAGITLRPSVGNGALPCRSHYVIAQGCVHWLPPMSDWEIAAERAITARVKGRSPAPIAELQPPEQAPVVRRPWYVRLWKKLFD